MLLDALTVLLAAATLFVVVAGRQLFIGSRSTTLPSVLALLGATVIVSGLRHAIFRRSGILSSLAVWRARLDAYPETATAVRAFMATRPAVFIVAHFAVVTIGLAPKASFTLTSDPFGNLPARFDAGW